MQRGRDLRYDMTLEFEEAVFGVEKEITIRRMETCGGLQRVGRGERARLRRRVRSAAGAGSMRFQQGFFSVARTCPRVQRDRHDDRRSVHDVQAARRG